MKRIGTVIAFAVLIAAAGVALYLQRHGLDLASRSGVPPPARVILIGIDTLRADHLSCYGYFRKTSPELERFVENDAIRFERAHSSASWTLPSMTSVFTSTCPPRHGVESKDFRLNPSVPTIASAFQQGGWLTAAFITHIYVSHIFGLDSGFKEFHELSIDWNFQEGKQLRAEELNQSVFPWLQAHSKDRFFLYLHYFDPHWDYDPPPPYNGNYTIRNYSGPATGSFSYLRKFLKIPYGIQGDDLKQVIGLYDGEIGYTDYHLGKLFEKLKSLGLWQDSLVVVFADHGEEFEDHGSVHHVHSLYEELLHVPLLIKLPGGRPSGFRRDVSETVQTLDIGPTLLQLSGLNSPSSFQGRSLLPLMMAKGENRECFARLWRVQSYKISIIRDGWKLVHVHKKKAGDSDELYYLPDDPVELRPLQDENPDRVRQLREEVLRWAGQQQLKPPEKLEKQLDEGQEEQLKALGYLD